MRAGEYLALPLLGRNDIGHDGNLRALRFVTNGAVCP